MKWWQVAQGKVSSSIRRLLASRQTPFSNVPFATYVKTLPGGAHEGLAISCPETAALAHEAVPGHFQTVHKDNPLINKSLSIANSLEIGKKLPNGDIVLFGIPGHDYRASIECLKEYGVDFARVFIVQKNLQNGNISLVDTQTGHVGKANDFSALPYHMKWLGERLDNFHKAHQGTYPKEAFAQQDKTLVVTCADRRLNDAIREVFLKRKELKKKVTLLRGPGPWPVSHNYTGDAERRYYSSLSGYGRIIDIGHIEGETKEKPDSWGCLLVRETMKGKMVDPLVTEAHNNLDPTHKQPHDKKLVYGVTDEATKLAMRQMRLFGVTGNIFRVMYNATSNEFEASPGESLNSLPNDILEAMQDFHTLNKKPAK